MRKGHNLKNLIESVKRKYGSDLSTPKGFLCLSMEISDRCGKSLSVATIKRIFGYVRYNNTPSLCTLNVLSNYIGYCDYSAFCDNQNYITEPILCIYEMHIKVGDIVEVEFPARNGVFMLQYKGNFTFRLL